MRDGAKSTLKICRPTHGPPGPLVVLLFGGGFIAGDSDQLTEYARICAQLFGATAVNISYRVGPEHKFPYAQFDAWDSLDWIAEHANSPHLSADPSKGFLVGGVSAGASIAAALSRKFQDHRIGHNITGQWLAVPSLMYPAICPAAYRAHYISLEQVSTSLDLTREHREAMQRAVQWDNASELRFAVHSKSALRGQPRTYFQVDGADPLRDDGLVYDEMLKEAGVPTKVDLYPGCPHAHWSGMRGYEIGNRALIDSIVGLGWLLELEVSREVAANALGLT
jgi:acetyl esterase/lipase